MKNYYVNTKAQSNGEHEVHLEECHYLPFPLDRKYLGSHLGCKEAVIEAKKTYINVKGCKNCSADSCIG